MRSADVDHGTFVLLTRKFRIGPGCWEWEAGRTTGGYGKFHLSGRTELAHRAVYQLVRGPIPDGLHLDHLCRNRACVRPDHLEPVTVRENLMRGDTPAARNANRTECVNGHLFDAENTYLTRDGRRKCRACTTIRQRRYRSR